MDRRQRVLRRDPLVQQPFQNRGNWALGVMRILLWRTRCQLETLSRGGRWQESHLSRANLYDVSAGLARRTDTA